MPIGLMTQQPTPSSLPRFLRAGQSVATHATRGFRRRTIYSPPIQKGEWSSDTARDCCPANCPLNPIPLDANHCCNRLVVRLNQREVVMPRAFRLSIISHVAAIAVGAVAATTYLSVNSASPQS